MTRYKHPLLTDQYKHVPEELRMQLACCCTCSFSGKPEAPKLSKAWAKVTLEEIEQQPATTGQPHSSSTRLMVGSKQLSPPLQPIFQQPANQQHGLWACKRCVATAAAAPPPPPQLQPLPPPPLQPQPAQHTASTSTSAALPHHVTGPPAFLAPLQQPQPTHLTASTPTTVALPHHIAAPSASLASSQQPQQQTPPPQQHSTVLTRLTREWYEAEIQRRSGERQQREAEIKRRSGERQQQVKEIQRLNEEGGRRKEAQQQQQQQLLVEMQREQARATAELQVLKAAVQQHIWSAPGKELVAVKRVRDRVEGFKQRGEQQRNKATAASKEQRSTEQRLKTLIKRADKMAESLTSNAAAAAQALTLKTAELEQQQQQFRELEERAKAAATQQLSLQLLLQPRSSSVCSSSSSSSTHSCSSAIEHSTWRTRQCSCKQNRWSRSLHWPSFSWTMGG